MSDDSPSAKANKINVNALAPIAHTRMTEDLPGIKAMANASEVLAPERIAPAALFLAPELARDITGQVLAVEGDQVFLFKMIKTEAQLPRSEGGWTAQELRERWAEISSSKNAE